MITPAVNSPRTAGIRMYLLHISPPSLAAINMIAIWITSFVTSSVASELDARKLGILNPLKIKRDIHFYNCASVMEFTSHASNVNDLNIKM